VLGDVPSSQHQILVELLPELGILRPENTPEST
jgi:hypothetical protein